MFWLFLIVGALAGGAKTNTWAGAANGALYGFGAWVALIVVIFIIAAIFGRK